MKPQQVRRTALSLPEASEQDHHGFPSFRVGKKIFATLPDDGHLHVMLDAEQTERALAANPDFCEELRWGARLAGLRVRLGAASPGPVEALLAEAWRRIAPRRVLERFDGTES